MSDHTTEETVIVEKGIPLPPIRVRGQHTKYPWKELEVGDSFYVSTAQLKSVRTSAYNRARKLGRKFIVRQEYEGVRVWRTA